MIPDLSETNTPTLINASFPLHDDLFTSLDDDFFNSSGFSQNFSFENMHACQNSLFHSQQQNAIQTRNINQQMSNSPLQLQNSPFQTKNSNMQQQNFSLSKLNTIQNPFSNSQTSYFNSKTPILKSQNSIDSIQTINSNSKSGNSLFHTQTQNEIQTRSINQQTSNYNSKISIPKTQNLIDSIRTINSNSKSGDSLFHTQTQNEIQTRSINQQMSNYNSKISISKNQNSNYNSNYPIQTINLDSKSGDSILNETAKRKYFSQEEDKMLTAAAIAYKEGSWNKIAECVPGRTPKQCRDRWVNYLQPSLKFEPWTDGDDKLLVSLVNSHGTHFAQMKTNFPNRSTNSLKNKWYWLVKQKSRVIPIKKSIKGADCQQKNIKNGSRYYLFVESQNDLANSTKTDKKDIDFKNTDECDLICFNQDELNW